MADRRVVVGVALGLAVVVAGCGGGSGGSSPQASPPASSAPAGTASSQPAASGSSTPISTPSPAVTELTRAQMKADLLLPSAVPAGYQLRIEQGIHTSKVLGCNRTGIAPDREEGVDFQKGSTGAEIDDIIRTYPSAAVATRAMHQIIAFAKVCHHAGLYTLKPISYPSIGGLTMAVSLREGLSSLGITAATGQQVFVLTGASIVEVSVLGGNAAPAAKSLPLIRAAVARLH